MTFWHWLTTIGQKWRLRVRGLQYEKTQCRDRDQSLLRGTNKYGWAAAGMRRKFGINMNTTPSRPLLLLLLLSWISGRIIRVISHNFKILIHASQSVFSHSLPTHWPHLQQSNKNDKMSWPTGYPTAAVLVILKFSQQSPLCELFAWCHGPDCQAAYSCLGSFMFSASDVEVMWCAWGGSIEFLQTR